MTFKEKIEQELANHKVLFSIKEPYPNNQKRVPINALGLFLAFDSPEDRDRFLNRPPFLDNLRELVEIANRNNYVNMEVILLPDEKEY